MTTERGLTGLLGVTSRMMDGAEPYVLTGSGPTVVLLHGWGGSPHGMRLVARDLHAGGCHVLVPRLAGNGTDPQDLSSVRALDWLAQVADLVEHLRPLGPVSVAGTSLGGILALASAGLWSDKLASVAAINAGVSFRNPEFVHRVMTDGDGIDMTTDRVGPMTLDANSEEVGYENVVLPRSSFVEVLGLMRIVEELLPNMTVPVQLLQSVQDTLFPYSNAEVIRDLAGSSRVEIVTLENSMHAAHIDFDAPVIGRELLAFVRSTQR